MTHDELLQNVRYDPATGNFFWKRGSKRTSVGDLAGWVNGDGYWQISINGKTYRAHRLAYLYVHGDLPVSAEIDHINGIKTDNRICNLRVATRFENSRNIGLRATNRSGVKGVYWYEKDRTWRARIKVDGQTIYVGNFKNLDEARIAVIKAREKAHGNFANHGV